MGGDQFRVNPVHDLFVRQRGFAFVEDSIERVPIVGRADLPHLPFFRTQKPQLQFGRKFLEQELPPLDPAVFLLRQFSHRQAVHLEAKTGFARGVLRLQVQHLDFEPGERQSQRGKASRAIFGRENLSAMPGMACFQFE